MSLVLRPPMLDDLGLRAALEWHVRTFATGLGLDVTFAHSGLERRFDPGIEIAVYRIVQEAVINVGRHAGVQHAAVRIAAAEGVLRLEICDAGAGFDTSGVSPTSSGLTGMRERVEAVGGSFAVESAPGAGTRISADIPIAGP
jgi:signal transduction histidine kinase